MWAWPDEKDDDVNYEDLKSFFLREFMLPASAGAQRFLGMPQQPLGDNTVHAAWIKMQALTRLRNRRTMAGGSSMLSVVATLSSVRKDCHTRRRQHRNGRSSKQV